MTQGAQGDPRHTESVLEQAYWQHHARVMNDIRPKIMGHVSTTVLEGIDTFTAKNPDSKVARLRKEMLRALGLNAVAGDPETVMRFNALYESAYDAVFPATRAYLKRRQQVDEISRNHSLSVFDVETLHAFDMKAHGSAILSAFRNELTSKLNNVEGIVDDVTRFSQAFEIYGKIIAYLYLSRHVQAERLTTREGKKTPDFKCLLPDGKIFFVEVKSFDVVHGDQRNREMMDDARKTQIDLEEQRKAGKTIRSATTGIEPFRKYRETNAYDAYSLIGVIYTLRDKSLQAFNEGQFDAGPTFALAIADRLGFPRRPFDLAPYYHDDATDGGFASGVLWHMAYGHPGTPIFRFPEFDGKASLEGHLDKCGLFVDKTQPFPGPGMIVLGRSQGNHVSLGLANEIFSGDTHWSFDDTRAVLGAICDHWNDHGNSRFFELVNSAVSMAYPNRGRMTPAAAAGALARKKPASPAIETLTGAESILVGEGEAAERMAARTYEGAAEELLTSDAFAARVGLKSRQSVHDWLKKGRIVGWRGAKRSYVFPAGQFDERGRPFEGLDRVVEQFEDGYAAWVWLTTELASLDGAMPLVLLARGEIDSVANAAEGDQQGDFA